MELLPVYLVSILARIFPRMAEDEYAVLVESIRQTGLRDEIAVWRGMVIDGFHRLLACLQTGVEPRFRHLDDDDDPLLYNIARNAHRRHLNKTALAAAAFRASEHSRRGRPGRRSGKCANLRIFPNRSEAARMFGVSRRAVTTMALVLGKDSASGPALRRAVETGRVAGSDAAGVAGEPDDVQEKAVDMVLQGESRTVRRAVERVKRESDVPDDGPEALIAPGVPHSERFKLYVSAVADLHESVNEGSVDAIVTFPPSGPEFLPRLSDLSDFAAHALKSNGAMFVLADARHLPDILEKLAHPDLNWICSLPYHHPGNGVSLGGPHRLSLKTKLLLVYGKAQFRMEAGEDVLRVPELEKGGRGNAFSPRLDLGMELIVSRFTRAGQIICDPFLLDRTETALAAARQERYFIGAWDDPAGVDRVRQRLTGLTGARSS